MAWGNTRVVNSEKVALTAEEKERDRQRRAEIERNRKLEEEREKERRRREEEKAREERRKREYQNRLQTIRDEITGEYRAYKLAIWIIAGIIILVLFNEGSGWWIGMLIATMFGQGMLTDARDKKISEESQRLKAEYGIKSKGFCYITTAICELEGKPDDCYELTTFRRFRDEYLLAQPEGKGLVDKYYETAPRIIKAIEEQFQEEQRVAIYIGVKEKYLMPCLSFIEAKEYEKCKETYIQMVEELEEYIDCLYLQKSS